MVLKAKQKTLKESFQSARHFSRKIYIKNLKDGQKSQLLALKKNVAPLQQAFAKEIKTEGRMVWPEVVMKFAGNA